MKPSGFLSQGGQRCEGATRDAGTAFGATLEQPTKGLNLAQPKQRLRLNLCLFCKQGVTGSNPVTSTNSISTLFPTYAATSTAFCFRSFGTIGTTAGVDFSANRIRNRLAQPLRGAFQVPRAGIDFRHGLRLVCHPEIVDVFQAALTTQPRFTEPVELGWSPLP
jgi:hypothetical protein